MKPKNILLFGASGQIGRLLLRKLTKNNYKVTAVTRNLHQKGYILKTQGNPGYIEVVETNIFDENNLESLIKNADICINLIGILFEKKNHTFKNIHVNFPDLISKICSKNSIEQFIHISALGIEDAIDSKYAISKLNGEKKITENFPMATILRPSIVFSVDDKFTTLFMKLLNIFPIFPIYYNGETKFAPIHCSDLVEIIFQTLTKKIQSEIIECVGPEVMTFKTIIFKLEKMIEKRRLLLPLPLFFAKIFTKILSLTPKPLLTDDQLRLLKYDNISSGNYKTNYDLGINADLKFDDEVKKYCYMWKEGGQFSKKN